MPFGPFNAAHLFAMTAPASFVVIFVGGCARVAGADATRWITLPDTSS